MADLENESLVARIRETIDRILNLEKEKVFAVEGERVYPSEAHLMLLMDRDPALNATGIADRLGLTKGAVSQTLSRLKKKGMLIKERDTTRKNELILTFTGRGRRAVARFLRVEAVVAARLDRHLSTLSKRERKTVRMFLDGLGEAIGSVG